MDQLLQLCVEILDLQKNTHIVNVKPTYMINELHDELFGKLELKSYMKQF